MLGVNRRASWINDLIHDPSMARHHHLAQRNPARRHRAIRNGIAGIGTNGTIEAISSVATLSISTR